MASLWQRHRPLVRNWAWAQAWTALSAPLGRARPRRPPWQRLEASMWTAAENKATETKTSDTGTPPAPDPPKPKPSDASAAAKRNQARLPGRIADVLDLEDTHRVPIVTYSPTEELFTMNKDVLEKALPDNHSHDQLLESRVAVNKYPQKWYLAEYYLKMRETMVAKAGVFHKRWRGTCASATGRFLSMNNAINVHCGNLGRRDWEPDPAREIRAYKDFRALDAKSTTAHVEYLKNGQAAALWVSIAPERYDGAGGGGFPATRALHYYVWANSHTPWKDLLYHLRRSPSLQLRAPALSPADPDYQIYPDGRRPAPEPNPLAQRNRAENSYLIHFMPLLMETFGPGGRRTNRLWTDATRNPALPVVLAWQDQYAWFLWRDGPDGPLELQQRGWWLPQIPPGQPNYAREQQLRYEKEKFFNMPPYGRHLTPSEARARERETEAHEETAKRAEKSRRAAKEAGAEPLKKLKPKAKKRLREESPLRTWLGAGLEEEKQPSPSTTPRSDPQDPVSR